MTRWSWKAVVAVAATGGITAAGAAGAIAASADSGDGAAARPVIVILKDQVAAAPATREKGADRAARVRDLQAPLTARVRAAGGTVSHAYTTLNGFSATVSADEAADLAKDPAVAEVVPDAAVPVPRPAISRSAGVTPSFTPGPTLAQAAQQKICPADPAQPLLEPEALQSTKATQANAIADGTGVKVAFVADGVDPANPDFQRGGKSIFSDYKDFSGDGTAAPTEGAEAFGDASSIAAQGNETYDLHTAANPQLPAGCTIKIKGIAPGATLVGIKVFPEAGAAQTSTILAGADYAVGVDHVDVLNYSLGSNPLPDEPALDALKVFNQQAVRAGVTVTISSGDAGVRNSVGSPAGDPGVLTLGASTDFRNYLQTGYGGTTYSGVTGWASDEISQISSGGVTQNGSVVDLLAPGEDGWAVCSPNQTTYTGCGDLAGNPSPIESFGGTSQSAPLAAGAAAVVIDAYRRAHGGATPTPALVKQLLTGSADDLGVPSREQGAGRLDVLAAAQAASSVPTADGAGDGTKGGSAVTTDPTQLDVAGPAGSTTTKSVTVTNTSPTPQTVGASLRQLSPLTRIAAGTVSLDAGAPTFPDLTGSRARRYRTATFTVPGGVSRLESRATWSSPDAGVRLALIDPDGTYTAFSRPQGVSDLTEASVSKPKPGRWTALIFTTADPALAAQPGFVGDVAWSASTATFGSGGAVSPSSLTLAPGASGQVSVPVALPANAGDSDQDLVLTSGTGAEARTTVVPVVRRSQVVVGADGGTFSGTITAGNGRDVPLGETDTVTFDVPAGQPSVTTSLKLGNDAEQLLAFLVDPAGNLVSNASNVVSTATTTKTTTGITLTHANPAAGTWRIIVQELSPASGTQEELPYTGTVSFAAPKLEVTGLPDSADVRLPAGQPVTAHVQVTNTGPGGLALALDPRTTTAGDQRLVSDVDGDKQAVPDPTAAGFNYTVPPATDALTATASSDQPISLDLIGALGNPDLVPQTPGRSVSTSYRSPSIAQGLWSIYPTPAGPFGTKPATPGTVTASLTAHTLGFDRDVSTSTGDPWLSSVDADAEDVFPQALAPGRTGTLDATITPKGADGTIVRGTLYVVTYDAFVGSGDVVAALPYTYTIGQPTATTPTTTGTTTTVTTPGAPVPVPVPVPGPPAPGPAPSKALTVRARTVRLSGRTATVGLTLSRRASVKLTVKRSGRTVARGKARTVAAGTRRVRFALGRRLARGTYRVTVTAQVGTKVSRSTLTLRVR